MTILSKRAQGLKPSPTLAINAKAKAMQAQGIKVVNFGGGEPDFDTPENIKRAAVKAIEEGFTKYTPSGGMPELKDAVIHKFQRKLPQLLSSEQLLTCFDTVGSIFSIKIFLDNINGAAIHGIILNDKHSSVITDRHG